MKLVCPKISQTKSLIGIFAILFFSITTSKSQNLVMNGDFESSGGFTSNYNLTSGPNSNPNEYAVISNPSTINSNFSNACVDHTTGSGKMMVVDGSNSIGNKIWEQSPGGGIPVTTGTVYTFSYWIQSISFTNAVGNLADIQVRINNVILAPTAGSTVCPSTLCSWTKVTYTWTATSNYAQIWLFDLQTSATGNDFALDDLSLTAPPLPLSVSHSLLNPTCATKNDGYIIAYGFGGTAPYTYSFDGGTFTSNNSLNSLTTSSHTITVKDALLNSVTSSVINLVAPANPLTVTATPNPICVGSSSNLLVSGGLGYNWNANPVDASLITPSASNPTVTPIATTTYTVASSNSSIVNLIYNGNFSAGNVGFISDYEFKTTNPSGAQKSYGVMPNPQFFFNTFSSCGDYTSTTGNMLVVDGSLNSRDKVWCQTAIVKPSTNYTFSYYIQTLTINNPALIQTKINGIVLPSGASNNPANAPATIVCGNWKLVSYNWTSGATDTVAQICLFDLNTNVNGNDFTIDEITFTASYTCNLNKAVTVIVNGNPPTNTNNISDCGSTFYNGITYTISTIVKDTLKSILGCDSIYNVTNIIIKPKPSKPIAIITKQPTCNDPFGTIVFTNPIGSNYEYSVDSGFSYSTSNIFPSYPLNTTYYLVVKDNSGSDCISDTSSITIGPIPNSEYPATPTGIVTIQPTCIVPTGTFVITSPLSLPFGYLIDDDPTSYAYPQTIFNWYTQGYHNVKTLNLNNGCISKDSLILLINPMPVVVATTNTLNFSSCKSIVYKGNTYTTSTVLKDTIKNYQGCDSLYNSVNISINSITPITKNTAQSGCGSLIYKGNTYASSTIVKDTIKSYQGCDSIFNIATLTVNAAIATPTASVTVQPNCSNLKGTIVITAPTGINLFYSIGGSFQKLATFGNLSPNNYDVVASDLFTGCASLPLTLTVNPIPAQPATPTASVTVQPTCINPSGTIIIAAPLGANLQYSVNGINFQSSPNFLGLSPKSYQVSVKNTGTGCVSAITSLSVNSPNLAPVKPTGSVTQQPNCSSPTGTITIVAPNGTNLQYSIDGVNYQSNKIFSGLAPATYSITVVDTTFGGCTSTALTLTLNAIPTRPNAPTASVIKQPSCSSPNGIIVIAAPIGTNYTYSVDGITYQSSTIFNSLNPNAYNVTVKDNNTSCVSAASSLTVNTFVSAPTAPAASVTVQPTCTLPTGIILVTAPIGSNYNYSIDGTNYQSSLTFYSLIPNTYLVSIKDLNAGCISSNISLVVNPIPTAPNPPTASVTAQPTCTTLTGTIVISAPTASNFNYSIDGVNYQASTTFILLNPNSYNLTVKDINTGCVSTAVSLTVNAVPNAPNTPTAIITAQPSCLNPTGTITITAPIGAQYEYSIGGVYQATTTFNNLLPNTYSIIVKDINTGCVSAAVSLTFFAVPNGPKPPIASVTAQPTCLTPTGTIVITAQIGINYIYSVDGANYQASNSFTGLLPANYLITVKDVSTQCISNALSLTVNAVPNAPNAPTAGITVQPTCVNPTGRIVVTAPIGFQYEYSIGGAFQAATSFAGLAPSNYSIIVKDIITNCISTAVSLTVNAVPSAPNAPTATITVQPTCVNPTGTIVITNPIGSQYEYSIGGAFQSATTFVGQSPNTYSITVKDIITNCISTVVSLTVNAVANAPSPPIASVTQPNCKTLTGNIDVNSPIGVNLQYSIGGAYQSSTNFTGVLSNTYLIKVKDISTGCISTPNNAIVNPAPAILTAPIVVSPLKYCADKIATPLSATGSSLLWYYVSFGGTGVNIAPTPNTSFGGTINYFVSQSNGTCESPRSIISVDVVDNPLAQITDTLVYILQGKYVQLTGEASGNNVSILWTPNNGIDNPKIENPILLPNATQLYTMTVTSADNCISKANVRIIVQANINIPNVFSPNGDGINDTWDIENIVDYPFASISIFNRSGQLIKSSRTTTRKVWDGIYNGQLAPLGVYYYIIKLTPNSQPISGSITVLK